MLNKFNNVIDKNQYFFSINNFAKSYCNASNASLNIK